MLCLVAFLVGVFALEQPPEDVIWLDTLDLTHASQWIKGPQAAKSLDGGPLTVGGAVYAHGVGAASFSEMAIDLKGAATRFTAVVGIDDETGGKGSAAFEVWLDGRKVAESGVLRGGQPPQTLSADLTGGHLLMLLVSDAGDGIADDHADWADAAIVPAPGAVAQPEVVPIGADTTVPRMASNSGGEPAINGPRAVGGTPGRSFLFLIPATGDPPLRYAADNLPAGLSLDPESGIISGAIAQAGATEVAVTVSNDHGVAARTLSIVAGEHTLALTPPMGWNSWNAWGIVVDAEKVRAAADAMVASGLAAQGYQYINIDDSWNDRRGPDGRLTGNKRFPDLKAIADYVHAKGLKIGIYSSPGPKTCQGYEGSYEHERLDAQTFAEWGFDYLKYDWCSYFNIVDEKTASATELGQPFRIMRDALDTAGRDMVYSLCQYGMGNVWEWGRDVGANLWRTTTDIDDSWSGMSNIGFNQAGKASFAGPGGWNDPDMLVVGQVGWGPSLHATRLTKNEQVTHISLWALLAAPLLIGCDLTQLDAFTRDLLANPDVIAVDQDPLGRPVTRITRSGFEEVWHRPIEDGSVAVGLFNRRSVTAHVSVSWAELGIEGPQRVRDLWTRQDVGQTESSFAAPVPPHGAILLSVTPR